MMGHVCGPYTHTASTLTVVTKGASGNSDHIIGLDSNAVREVPD